MTRPISTSAKPIGYYCPLSSQIENAFGSHFENLSKPEQFTLLAIFANFMAEHSFKADSSYTLLDSYCESPGALPSHIAALLPEVETHSDGTILALTEALVAHLLYTKEVQR